MARTAQLAVAAARLALDESGLPAAAIDPRRVGVTMGAGVIPGGLDDLGVAGRLCLDESSQLIDLRKWGREGLQLIPPTWMLLYVPNMPACHVAILNDAQGPNNTLTQFDAASLFALLEARRTILRGSADVMLAGGSDVRTDPCAVARGFIYRRLSCRNECPEAAVRPFGRGRDGEAVAEGAGVMVLEDSECARRRGVKVLAEVVGGGSAFDRNKSGRGLARAIRAALDEAGIGPPDLDHVNAAAGGLVDDDAWEARALAEALGGEPVPVLAMKSYFGNVGNGASVLELAASVLALNDGVVPATLNADDVDPDCAVCLTSQARPTTRPYVLKVAYTDQGQCAAVVIRCGS
jgi:3-oxoacyl-[acyl-carrier-protein] synthase II